MDWEIRQIIPAPEGLVVRHMERSPISGKREWEITEPVMFIALVKVNRNGSETTEIAWITPENMEGLGEWWGMKQYGGYDFEFELKSWSEEVPGQ